MNFVIAIFIFIAITAGFGVTLFTMVLKDKERPMAVVGLKGIFAGATLSLITVYGALHVGQQNTLFNTSFVLFWGGALVGVFMLVLDKMFPKGVPTWLAGFPIEKKGRSIPKPLAYIHAGTMIAAVICFIIFILSDFNP